MFRRLLSLLRRKPKIPIVIEHARLGRLTYSDGMWSGHVAWRGSDLDVALAGSEIGPDGHQLNRVLSCLEKLETVEVQTMAFVRAQLQSVPEAVASEFAICALWFLWPQLSDYFMVILALRGDEFGLWKVEFVNGLPKHFSLDD